MTQVLEKTLKTAETVPYRASLPKSEPSLQLSPSVTSEETYIGSPEAGTIHYLRQTHPVTGKRYTPIEKAPIIASQEAILRRLEQEKFAVVAQEGLQSSITPSTADRKERLRVAEVQETFPNGKIPAVLTKAQRELLFNMGASRIYAALHPKVTILSTVTPEEEESFNKVIDDKNVSKEERDFYIFNKREEASMRHVTEYMTKHPNSRVALIYGADHKYDVDDMPANLPKTKRPSIITVSFPRTQEILPYDLQDRSELEQLRIVSVARGIHYADFQDIKTEQAQLKALMKIVCQYPRYDDAEAFKERLLKGAVSDAVKDQIEKLFQSKAAPFNVFEVRKGVTWTRESIAKMHPLDASDLLKAETDPRTQFEIIKHAKAVFEFHFDDILTGEGQMLALRKLSYTLGKKPNFTNIEELKESLLIQAHDDSVREAIEDLYTQKKGPFAPASVARARKS